LFTFANLSEHAGQTYDYKISSIFTYPLGSYFAGARCTSPSSSPCEDFCNGILGGSIFGYFYVNSTCF